MKKTLAIGIICTLLVTACGCGSKESTSATDKAVSVAEQAIDAIDGYLDGKTSGSSARDKLSDLYDEMDYVDDLPRETAEDTEQYAADWSIQVALSTASSQILLDSYNGDSESFDKIVDTRNRIAEDAGLETK